ncbi:sugar transferase [Psychromonas aquimarina]|uniref:sugar transferase n=1 Tax=Psychromonas aquimarina TaxID=444919 RepID=UPI00042081A9|nr:sugar transferase [Psychromonas aquimarina]
MSADISETAVNNRYKSNADGYIHPAVKYGKRLFDLVFSISLIFLLLPLLPFIALLIKIDSQGPVFYQQQRLGRSRLGFRHQFSILKFRSMYTDAETGGVALLASESDPRITRVGKFLRKTRFDEIPQLINILSGDMSLIGPRPERPELTCEIEKKMPFFRERTYLVLPGLTGLAQINQSYLGSVNNLDQKLAFDHAYSLAISTPLSWLKTDVQIFLKTVLTVIKCNG